MVEEIWRPVYEWEDRYEVSNLGRIRSIWRQGPPILRKLCYNTARRCVQFQARKKGRVKNLYVHRCVYIAFVGNISKGRTIDHIDGDPKNNNVNNLRCCSQAENVRNRRMRNGKMYKGVFFHKNDKKWEAQVGIDGKTHQAYRGDCPHEAARAYNEAAKKYHGEFAYLNEVPDGPS